MHEANEVKRMAITKTTERQYLFENAPAVLSVQNLSVVYNDDTALENVSFDLQKGEKLAVIGPNGAGKSTLIKTIIGLLTHQSGTIRIADNRRERLGYVPQYQAVNWDFPVTVQDAVMMGLTRQIGWLRFANRKHRASVQNALQRVGLGDVVQRQIGELSGGQRQRVFIARALAQQADVLLLDEPFAGVDVGAQGQLMSVLESLNQSGLTILLATHDLSLAFQHFDRVLAIRKQVIAFDTPEIVYHPDTLAQLYGGRVATWQNDQQVMVFVDDHACEGC